MNDVSEIAVCPLSSDAELVSQAKMLWDGIIRSSRDMIRYKFAIGGLVRIALTHARHDDAAVTRLATELTNACGKLILPQRLYEAARLHEAFAGRLELVWEFERRLPRYTSQPLSYTYLIRQILPRVTKDRAWNHQEWEHYQEEQLGRLEQAVEQIEALSRPVPVPERPATEGQAQETDSTGGILPPVSVEPSAQSLITVCRESVGYQHFSGHVLVATIHRAIMQLASRVESVSPSDRELLSESVRQLQLIEARVCRDENPVGTCAA